MYYSYVEIEYVATSFSPARTDLAVKLLRRPFILSTQMGDIGGTFMEGLSEFGCLLSEEVADALRIGRAGNEDGFRHGSLQK
jgi:hypothetical protein